MILGLSMKARMGLSKFIVIIPKTTFGVLNFVFQRARERGGCFGGMRFLPQGYRQAKPMVSAKRRGRRADWRPRACLRAQRDFDHRRKGRA